MNMWNYHINDLEEIKSPLEIVQNQCSELSNISNGKIIARVMEYNGVYKSDPIVVTVQNKLHNNSLHFDDIIESGSGFNVQDIMGDKYNIDSNYSNEFVYELFVTSKKTPKYKYRIFFMYYGIDLYPVGLTIQEDIAKEIEFASEGMNIGNEEEFIKALKKILGSVTLGNILRKLILFNI